MTLINFNITKYVGKTSRELSPLALPQKPAVLQGNNLNYYFTNNYLTLGKLIFWR